MKKAIIIGATSGIGRSLAVELTKHGYRVGVTGRRVELLDALVRELGAVKAKADITDVEASVEALRTLVKELGGADVVVISSGIGFLNDPLELKPELDTIETNVKGFTAVAAEAYKIFAAQGSGHIVGISSIMALRGSALAPAYAASKAYVSNYLEGLRVKAAKAKLDIFVTDVMPGYVDTVMAKGEDKFWVAPPEKAATQIFRAIEGRKAHVYITKRWRLIGWLFKLLPFSLYKNI